jgi:hypothetical protein
MRTGLVTLKVSVLELEAEFCFSFFDWDGVLLFRFSALGMLCAPDNRVSRNIRRQILKGLNIVRLPSV